jgi:DNA-binding NtrC family response regulator
MAQVLVVDKDRLHNMSLGLTLSAHDHGVQLTSIGQEAIDLGLRLRPDVLIVDWMLEDDLNGVEVAEALRSIHPETRAILVTAHASGDVRKLAKNVGFSGFLEKPLAGDSLAKGIENVLGRSPQPCRRHYGFLEYTRDGRIPYVNARARQLLRIEGRSCLQDLFSARGQSELTYAKGNWVELSLAADESSTLWGYARPGYVSTGFLFLLGSDDYGEKDDPMLAKLLYSDRIGARDSAGADRVIILDPDPLQRRLATSQLKTLGCPFHSVESCEAVLKVLESEGSIGVLFVDYAAVAEGGEEFFERIRSSCPGVTISGFSTQYRAREFQALGVEEFVLKPLVGDTLRGVLERARSSKAEAH